MAYQMFTQNVNGLSNDDIIRFCPSVFAAAAHESRSSRYTPIPTTMVLDGLADAGFIPTTAMQSKSRVEGKSDFTKHLLRLRRIDDLGASKPDVHEVVLVNSHDGTSSYVLYAGIFRLVCTNGMIIGDIDSSMRVQHKGDIVQQVVDSTLQLVEDSEQVMETVEEMKQIQLSRPEQLLLSEFAMHGRFNLDDEQEDTKEVPYQPSDFLRIHRNEDVHNDLYTTTNVIQENLLRGGISRRDHKGKRHTTRAIHGIDQSVKTNKLLWQFSQRMMELKNKS